jgi:YidC/Oxa1 family membrane protein insertase
MIENEEEAKKREAVERRAASAPAPGAKPKRAPKALPAGGDESPTSANGGLPEARDVAINGEATGAAPSNTWAGKPDQPTAARDSVKRTPRPGIKPKKRKR